MRQPLRRGDGLRFVEKLEALIKTRLHEKFHGQGVVSGHNLIKRLSHDDILSHCDCHVMARKDLYLGAKHAKLEPETLLKTSQRFLIHVLLLQTRDGHLQHL
jgi:hypothetical protein